MQTRQEGTPQVGPLSPLLSNILLNELDKELENRGHKFVRYADDCSIKYSYWIEIIIPNFSNLVSILKMRFFEFCGFQIVCPK